MGLLIPLFLRMLATDNALPSDSDYIRNYLYYRYVLPFV